MSAAPPPRAGHFWKWRAVAELIRRGRAGESWETIGCRFYPHHSQSARGRLRVRSAAAEIWRRYATEDDRRARRAAVRGRNWNKPPGFSRRAERRRRQLKIEPPRGELNDLWAGLGACFATPPPPAVRQAPGG